MKAKHISILILIILYTYNYSKAKTLSNKAEISIITCGTGEEIHSLFGHTCLRIKDNNFDYVFNYGTFNFDTPNFYGKFITGRLLYIISADNYSSFKRRYIYYKRSIIEQKINISTESKQKILDALLENMKEENKYYRYNFLFNNCTTKIRDILINNSLEKIEFNTKDQNISYWNILDEFMEDSPWIYFGIHTLLGKDCDKKASPNEYSFIPNRFKDALNNAYIIKNNEKTKLITNTEITYMPSDQTIIQKWYSTPFFAFSCLSFFIFALTFYQWKNNKYNFIIDGILFSILGLIGYLVAFMWFVSIHAGTENNFNILWAVPFHFPIALFLFKKEKPKWIKNYFGINALLLIICVATWNTIGQSMPSDIIILLIALHLRSLVIFGKA